MLSLDESISDGDVSHKSVRDILKEKHPDPTSYYEEAILDLKCQPSEVNSILFHKIDGLLIREMALKCSGAAGPSGLDDLDWRRLCTEFQNKSLDLCNPLASVACRISTEFIDHSGIAPLVACRLIALDKNPGVRPIGVCETVRRIISKAALNVVKNDILTVVGALQLCAGQDAGCEVAVYSMHAIFDNPKTEAVLLVDATDAFNNFNCHVALRNISMNRPAIFPTLANTYRLPAKLFVGGEVLLSMKGTTQGDPLAMPMYA